MATWNHRVIDLTEENENGDPIGFTENAIGVCGESFHEMQETINRLERALSQPILKPSDFVVEEINDEIAFELGQEE